MGEASAVTRSTFTLAARAGTPLLRLILVTAGLVAGVAPLHVRAQASAPTAPATIDDTLQGCRAAGRRRGRRLAQGQLDLGTSVVQFERQGALIFVRDLTSTFEKRASVPDPILGIETARTRPID